VIVFRGRYLEAITHSSYVKEHSGRDNELLEFSGDAVLQLCVSDMLLELFPDSREGDLTRMRHQLVNNQVLAQIGRDLQLGQIIRLGKGELSSGGRSREKNLANAVEALLGALYAEQGLEAVRHVVWAQLQEKAQGLFSYIPAKQRVHEWSQKRYHKVPVYQIIEELGPAHNRSFVVAVFIDDEKIATGAGPSKKKASIAAAEEAAKQLKI